MKKLVAPLILLAALAACSSPEQTPPQIASLNTSSAGPATSTTAPAEERPRRRLDMTPADIDALYEVLVRCMVEHGVDKTKFDSQGVPSPQVMEAADKACESKQPLPPWEKDAKNPEAADFANRVVQCLRAKGVRYVEVYNDPGSEMVSYAFGGPNNDSESISKGLEFSNACEREVSGK